MSKLKKSFGIAGLSALSLTFLGGVGIYANSFNAPQAQITKADVSTSIENNLPEYFLATFGDANLADSPLALVSGSDKINLKFSTDENGLYNKNSENEWQMFNFTNVTIKRNGAKITPIESDPSFISSGETKYENDTVAQSFVLDVKLGAEDKISGNELTLKDEGVYEITIEYTLFTTEDNGTQFSKTENLSLNLSFMLFNHDTYLESNMSTPRVTSNISDKKSFELNAKNQINYYFNFNSDELPYITYDATKYNLSIKHTYNLSSINYDFVYNFKDNKVEYDDHFKTKQIGDNLSVYFEDLGDYTLDFDLIYGFESDEDYNIYTLPFDVNNQKLYVYGYESTYTKFDSLAKKNLYPEFKNIDENLDIIKAADVTKQVLAATGINLSDKINTYINTENITPASSNQAPIKFKEFANLKNATLYKVTKSDTSLGLDSGTPFTAIKNISDPGKYVVLFTYTFENYRDSSGYIDSDEEFNQIFYFEITNETPSVDVFEGIDSASEKQLSSGDYTNKNVFIRNNYKASAFNSDVDITINRHDFVNNLEYEQRLSDLHDENGFYKFTENGNYTITISYGRNGDNKIVRRFNIDKTAITDISALSVKLNGTSSTYSSDGEIQTLTNQPIIFSHQQQKNSGANVYAYYKYYPIEANAFNIEDETLSDILQSLVTEGYVPVEFKLKLNPSVENEAPWIFCQNARSVESSSNIASSYVKTAPGLYILEVYDDAGNTSTKMYLLDNTAPNFVIYQDGKYRFLENNETLSKDATIYWGQNKLLGVELPANDSSSFFNGNIANDDSIKDLFTAFKNEYYVARSEQTSLNNLKIAINDKVLIKDPISNYDFTQENSHTIISSFKLCYTENIDGSKSYYFSTTTNGVYVEIDPQTACINKKSATEARLNGPKVTILGNTKYYPDASTMEIVGTIKDYDNFDGQNYDNIYNIEGNYTFLIRDASNTKTSYDDKTTYTTYPSGYKLLQLTSDSSLMQVGYKNNTEFTPIVKTADYAATEGKEADQKVKFTYYEPTAINKQLYISLMPTVDQGEGKTTQVDKVLITYYPFVNKSTSFRDSLGKFRFGYYKDISETPEYKDVEVYSFETNGSSTENITIALQSLNNVTAEGVYKISRVYKLGDNYTMSEYDYFRRTLTLIVDRDNVITEPEVIEIETKTYEYDFDSYTFNVFDKYIRFNDALSGNYRIIATLLDDSTEEFNSDSDSLNNSYVTSKKIKSIALYNGNAFIESETSSSLSRSTQSITGNGIFVSVFALTDSSKEYPMFKTSETCDSISLNSGYTFYTKKMSYEDYELKRFANSVFTTNKIPFKIYIPAFKYTQIIEDTEGFKVKENKNLNYFYENDIEKSTISPINITFDSDCAIESYKLFAEIYHESNLATPVSISTDVDEYGFLTFNNALDFQKTGKYIVVIKQAKDDIAGNDSFLNAYSFAFNVEKTEPSFELYNNDGKALKFDSESNYYTNSDKIITTWQDSQSDYILNVDKKNIKLKLSTYIDEFTLVIEDGEIISCKNAQGVDLKDYIGYSYNETTRHNTLEIDLEKIALNSNGNSLQITMSYDIPEAIKDDSRYSYNSTAKKIIIDKTIFDIISDGENTEYTSTVDSLFAKINNIDSESLNLENLRILTKSNGSSAESKAVASYSSSSFVNNFYRYYSYPVDKEFFDLLEERMTYNILNNPTGFTEVYARKIKNIYDSNINFEETTYLNFSESSNLFTKLKDLSLTQDFYYEIIETDYAGNILVYLVYLKNSNGDGLTYHSNSAATETIIKDQEIESNLYNIHGKTDMYLDSINLHGDKWNFVELENNGIRTKFVFSPYINSNSVKNISTGEVVTLNSILSNTSTTQKAKLYITDRSNNTVNTVYINRSNTSNLKIESAKSGQGIQIALPNENVSTGSLIEVYPVEIIISVKETGNDSYIEIANFENDPNKNLESGFNYQSNWNNVGNEVLTASYENGYLVIKFNNEIIENTKVLYTVVDNFGNRISEIQINGTDFIDSVDHPDRYQSQDSNGDLYYRTQSTFEYRYNSLVYSAKVYQNNIEITSSEFIEMNKTRDPNSIKFDCKNQQLNEKFEIRVFDSETTDFSKENSLKQIFVHLYNLLPVIDGNINAVTFKDENGTIIDDFSGRGSVLIDGRNYTFKSATTFASVVTITYPESNDQFPYSAYLFKDGESGLSKINNKFRIEKSGIYYILFKYTDEEVFTNEYVVYRLEVLDSSANFYYVTVDGMQIKAQTVYFTDEDGKQYSNYYIVNVPYTDRSRIEVVPNEYQKVAVSVTSTISSMNATTVIYTLTNNKESGFPVGVSPYTDNVVISFVAPTDKPAKEISYESNTGELVNLIDNDGSSVIIAIDKESTNSKLKIRWNKFYGLTQNLISLKATKDGFEYNLPVFEEDSYFYTNLTISGTYHLTFKDNSGNVELFGNRNYLDIIFLKDVHFTMTHTNLDGDEVETEAIDRGVFNGPVKLNVKNLPTYYSQSAVGTGSGILKALRNGEDYNRFTFDATNVSFLFEEVGFYQVTFSATTINGVELREQTYCFTIINPNESRYAYEFAPFSTYTVTKSIKDNGINIEENDNLNLDSIYLSYDIDGNAKWTLTIDTNQILTPGSTQTTKFEFTFLIRSAVPPISVSAPEGSTSTKTITITFNKENVYNSVGDCIVSVGNQKFEINSNSTGVETITITAAGTYYVQVHTISGNLLYSYKITKKDPLNGWAITAIVIGSIVLIAGIIIVIKLRKRIKVK